MISPVLEKYKNKGGLTQATPTIKNPKPITTIVTARDLPYSAMVRVARVASQIERVILMVSPEHIRKTHQQQLFDRELEESHEYE